MSKTRADPQNSEVTLQEYRNVVESLDAMIAVMDMNRVYTLVNHSMLRQLGLGRKDVIGKPADKIQDNNFYEEMLKPTLDEAFDGECVCREHDRNGADGEKNRFQIKHHPLKNSDNHVEKVLSVIRDITQQIKIEEEMRKIQKIESIGSLAGGIAHDFNNILGAILGYTNLAQLHIEDGNRTLECLDYIQDAVSRATKLTSRLLAFSRSGASEKSLFHLQPVIRESSEFALSGSSIRAVYAFDDLLYPVRADRELIAQAIQNLVVNAAQAMPDGGTIRIRASNILLNSRNRPALPPGNYVKIEVLDTGAGIRTEHMQNIFEPFFTTKNKAQGLGLPAVHSIARKHGGNVTVDSKPGEGSSFAVFLPAAENGEKRAAVEPVREDRKRILVMDDDEATRKYAKTLLTELGYDVLPAVSGEEAVALYKEALASSSPVDIAILDLTIRGGMGGLETCRKLLDINPDVKTVVVSGYTNDPAMTCYEDYGFKAMLPKPYDLKLMAETLRRLLEKE